MENNTVYLVTGANRGIGLALITALARRPNSTVIATSRKPVPDSYAAATTSAHPTSKVVGVLLDEENPAITSATLAARLAADHGIHHVDVVVANAGASSGFRDILDLDPDTDLVYDFTVNAVGPAKLFKGMWPLLQAGGTGRKFVVVSSSMGSIAGLDGEGLPGTAYGMSKAAVNFLAKKLSKQFKDEGLLVGVLHPGWVQTAMGQEVADAINFKEPPMTAEESAAGIVERIDGLTAENSGQFMMHNGTPLPW